MREATARARVHDRATGRWRQVPLDKRDDDSGGDEDHRGVPMTDPVPSKERDISVTELREADHFANDPAYLVRIARLAADEIERLQTQIATLKGYIERTALAGYRCAECAARLTAEPCALPFEKIAHAIYCEIGACGGDPMCFPGADEVTRQKWIEAVSKVLSAYSAQPPGAGQR